MHGLIVKTLQESNAILVLKLVLELYSEFIMAGKNNFIYLIYMYIKKTRDTGK